MTSDLTLPPVIVTTPDTPTILDAKLPEDQFVDQTFKKVQIYIHHTASDPNPFGVQQYWISNAEKVGTAFIIGGWAPSDKVKWVDGGIYQCFPEDKGGWHLGLKYADLARGGTNHKSSTYLNMGAIGIEMCSWGGLVLKKGKYVSYAGESVPKEQIQDYGKKGYRGYQYYQKYSPAQIESLRQLLTYLCGKYQIDIKYKGDEIFDIDKRALCGENGIFTHTSVRTDKQDCHPQPELITMLEAL